MPVKPFLDYLLLEKKYSLHTHKAYRANLLSFQEFIEQSKPGSEGIEKVAYSEVRSWIVSLIQQGNSTRTVNRKLSVLRSYYKFLVRTGHIEVSPLKEHKALKTATKVPLPFSEKEVNEAIEGDFYSDDYNGVLQKTIVNLLYYTGIRRSELIDLKKVHLDLENNLFFTVPERLLYTFRRRLGLYIAQREKVNRRVCVSNGSEIFWDCKHKNKEKPTCVKT
jgi:integrase/recombinase XerC